MTASDQASPAMLLGPLLRYVSDTEATIWLETDRACQVEILGSRARTFEVAGHHYALVVLSGLRPGTSYEYQVALDGAVRWPEPGSGFPPSTLRTLDVRRPVRLVFGSCRTAQPPAPRRGLARLRPDKGPGPDALRAYALDLREQPAGQRPDVLLLIGDQVYADEVGPQTRAFLQRRRDPSQPPGDQVADFTEYCFLYREAWSEPAVRWLLSVVPTAMVFDDHDVHDDWNISAAWRREFRAQPWWRARIGGAFLSYWIYQHLGNLSPAELSGDEWWRQVQRPGDAGPALARLAARADAYADGAEDGGGGGAPRWSFRRTFGRVRLVVIDSRAGRVVGNGKRLMVGEAEWRWVAGAATGDWDHLVLATSVPLLLPHGLHDLEAWNEAVCGGAWGRHAARAGERLRQAADLEHWAAFGTSFGQFERLLTEVATASGGQCPASVTVISGDIHHSYLAAVDIPAGVAQRSAVYQAVCSPIHNALPDAFRRGQRLATSRAGERAAWAVARLAGVGEPRLRWRITRGPWFLNMLASMEFEGRAGHISFLGAASGPDGAPRLQSVCDAALS